jgi:hypothetical protein
MQQTRNITTTLKTPFACAAPRRPSARTITMHNMRSAVRFRSELSPHHPQLCGRRKRPPCSETRPRHRDPVSVTSIAGAHVINPPNSLFFATTPSPLTIVQAAIKNNPSHASIVSRGSATDAPPSHLQDWPAVRSAQPVVRRTACGFQTAGYSDSRSSPLP